MSIQSIVIVLMLAVTCSGQTQSGISGTISISPSHPGPIRLGEPVAKPLADFAFVVESENGREVASFTTNSQGHFEVALPAGHYKIRPKEKQSSIGYYGPWEVDVASGKMTPVEWRCDSGMR